MRTPSELIDTEDISDVFQEHIICFSSFWKTTGIINWFSYSDVLINFMGNLVYFHGKRYQLKYRRSPTKHETLKTRHNVVSFLNWIKAFAEFLKKSRNFNYGVFVIVTFSPFNLVSAFCHLFFSRAASAFSGSISARRFSFCSTNLARTLSGTFF